MCCSVTCNGVYLTNTMKQLFAYLERIPRSRDGVLLTVLLISTIVALATYLVFMSDKLGDNLLFIALVATAFYSIWIVVLFALQRKDRISLRDLGMSARDAVRGVWAGFYIFVGVNLIFLALSLLTTKQVMLAENFRSLQLAGQVVGTFVFSILAGAFIEEAIYRAYLIPQFYLRLQGILHNSYAALAVAVLASQLLFALSHVPHALLRQEVAAAAVSYNFVQLLVGGLIHAVVYLRTRNLLFVTLVHAFINFSLTVIETPVSFRLLSLGVTVLIALAWPFLFPDRNKLLLKKLSSS
jgi:uncharacterized protein